MEFFSLSCSLAALTADDAELAVWNFCCEIFISIYGFLLFGVKKKTKKKTSASRM
jgi:hypothetical protein